METTILSAEFTNAATTEVTTQPVSKTNSLWEEIEYNRFGITPFLLVIVACIGGFAGAFAILDSPLKLAIVVLSTGIAEALMLAVLPMRTIVIASCVSVVISLLTIIL
jgi:hypothetical protein